jgi:hypothetical protein
LGTKRTLRPGKVDVISKFLFLYDFGREDFVYIFGGCYQKTQRSNPPNKMKFPFLNSKLFLPIFVFTFSASVQAQVKSNISVAWGDNYELPAKHEDVCFIGSEKDGYVQIGHASHRSLSFQRFDEQLHLKTTNTVSLENMPDDYQNVSFNKVGDKYYWFFCTWSRKDETERLFVQELDVKNAQLIGSAKEICSSGKIVSTDVSIRVSGWGFSQADKWNLYYSLDSNKILVQYRKKPEQRRDAVSRDVIGLHVYDHNMNKMWGKEVTMPYTEKRMDNEDYSVDKDGNVYLLSRVYNEDRGGKNPDYRMEIMKWSKDVKDVTKIPFKTGSNFVSTAVITKDFAGQMMIVGYYSKKKNSGSTDGVMLLKLDEQTGELSNIRKGLYEFPAKILSEFESARTRRRNERKSDDDKLEASNLKLRNVVVGSDGSIQVFGEEYYVEVTTTYNGRTTTTRYDYHYNDILAMNIGSDGELQWVSKVPKQQHGNRGRNGMSYKLFSYKGDHYLFFMDNMKNVDIAPDEQPATHIDGRGGILMAVKLDSKGGKSKAKVFDIREEDKNLIVSNFSELGRDRIMGRAFHRRESQPFFIQFKD